MVAQIKSLQAVAAKSVTHVTFSGGKSLRSEWAIWAAAQGTFQQFDSSVFSIRHLCDSLCLNISEKCKGIEILTGCKEMLSQEGI